MAQQQPEPTGDDVPYDDILAVELTTTTAGGAVIRLVGELDVSNVDSVRAATAKAVSEGALHVVFDLADLEFIDSSGITALLAAVSQADSVRIRQPSVAARRIIETTGLTDVLRFEH
jgi:anti-anti-sigma factor